MKKYTIALIIASTLLLSACAKKTGVLRSHTNDYQEYASSVHTFKVPNGNQLAYYPIAQPKPGNVATSTLPPGFYPDQVIKDHDMREVAMRQAKKGEKMATVQTDSTMTTAAANATELPLTMSMKTAWAKVSDSLQQAGYQILDQDESLHSYYVLDSSQTDHKITTSTPIERVLLTPKDQQVIVSVLDQNNKPASADISGRILGAIKG